MNTDFQYEINQNGTLTVTGAADSHILTIPAHIDGIAVTAVGYRAFAEMEILEIVHIPTGVETIGEEAFADCHRLSSITIPETLRRIGDYAFHSCDHLATISLNEGLEFIGDGVFEGCSRLDIERFPESLAHIGGGAISDCRLIDDIETSDEGKLRVIADGIYDTSDWSLVSTLPGVEGRFRIYNECTRVVRGAFIGCSRLRELLIPESVCEIERGAIVRCENLSGFYVQPSSTHFEVADRHQTLYTQFHETLLRVAPGYRGRTVHVHDGCLNIAAGAFKDCTGISKVCLSSNLRNIEKGSLSDLPNLGCVMIPLGFTAEIPDFEFVDANGAPIPPEFRGGSTFLLKDGRFVQSGEYTGEDDEEESELGKMFKRMEREHGRERESRFKPLESTGVTFADVCGQERAKEELTDKAVLPQRFPEAFKRYGLQAGGGILLYGPPGTGKTMLARAVAGEVKAKFFAVSTTDIYNKWLGESESRIRELFETARANAPSVIFIDDFDAIGGRRKEASADWKSGVLTQLLVEMQGIGNSNEGVLVLAATNRPQDIDSALKRPGRFDVQILCDLPGAEARTEMIRRKVADAPHARIPYKKLAELTEGFNGADIDRLVRTAKLRRLKESVIRNADERVCMKDFEYALTEVRSSVNPEDVRTAEEYRTKGTVSKREEEKIAEKTASDVYVPSAYDFDGDPGYS